MNKIICDNQECKAEISITKDLIETKHLSGGIEIRFFRCSKCGVKTLIDVTDQATRFKQDELRNLTKELKNIYENVTDETLLKVEKVSKELYEREETLIKEIKEAKAELKKKYEGEL